MTTEWGERDLTFERMLDWVEGRLSGAEAAAVAEVLAGDPDRRATVDWIRTFLRVTDAPAAADPPAHVRETLLRRFEDRLRAVRRPWLAERVRATLTFDSGMGLIPAGARGMDMLEVGGSERHLVYSAPGLDVALDIYLLEAGAVRIDGQILSTRQIDDPGFVVRLLRGTEEIASATADDLSQFWIDGVRPDAYRLVVTGRELEITADLDLGR